MGGLFGLAVLVGVALLLTPGRCDVSCSGMDGRPGAAGIPGRAGLPGAKGAKGEPGKSHEYTIYTNGSQTFYSMVF